MVIDRRVLFKGFAGMAAVAALGSTLLAGCDDADPEIAGGDPVTPTADPGLHLLKRATFGLTSADVARVRELGIGSWLDDQLDPARLDTAGVEAKVASLPLVAASPVELIAYRGPESQQAAMQLRMATAIRQIESPAQLYERMVEFWSDHFNVPMTDDALRTFKIVEDREVIRAHALGRFRDLLLASATSPAMLHYLDGARSFRKAINENYARELLELHTVGVDGGYKEQDVVQLAHLLTGWTIERGTGQFEFLAARHDEGPVEVMGWVRPTGGDPFGHGQEFLAWLAVHPNTARFIATKLARRFVADQPSDALVERLAAVYLANDTAVVPVLRAMFTDPEFQSAPGGKFRRPNDWLIAAMRATGSTITPSTEPREQQQLVRSMGAVGQPSFGWPDPNGYPDTQDSWLTAGGLLARWNMAGDLSAGAVPLVGPAAVALRPPLEGRPVGELVDHLTVSIVGEPPTDEGRTMLVRHTGLPGGRTPSADELGEVIQRTVAFLLSTVDFQYR
jgi:uncharacterized protein (DUF1800 family)